MTDYSQQNAKKIKITLRWLTAALVLAPLGPTSYFRVTSPDQVSDNLYFSVVLILLLLLVLVLYPLLQLRSTDTGERLKLDESSIKEVKAFIEAKNALKRIEKKSSNELRAKENLLKSLKDSKGRHIATHNGYGQIKINERWLETPVGSGPIMGVQATSVITSNRQNLIIEGLSSFEPFLLIGGEDAPKIARQINYASTSARKNEEGRQERLKNLPSEIALLENDPRVAEGQMKLELAERVINPKLKEDVLQRIRRKKQVLSLLAVVSVASIALPNLTQEEKNQTVTSKPSISSLPSSSTTSLVPKPSTFTMPDIIGNTYSEASDLIEGYGSYLDYVDVLEDRSVWDTSNWLVLRQNPSAGTKVSTKEKICAGVAKLSETWRTPKHFGCWSTYSGDFEVNNFSSDVMYLTSESINQASTWRQFRVTLEIETDDGTKLKTMYCTEKAVATKMRIGRLRLSGKYFTMDAQIFSNYYGQFRYAVEKVEHQNGTLPC